jgi:glyoxylase-like metal-dependent hydrolase (beta-lactamase superfamily II)
MVNRRESLFPRRAPPAYAPAPMPPAIYTYTAAANGLFVNSYLVETDDGVVAIDAGLLVSDAVAFRARLDALHKPLLAVFITHGHPDHFNGVVELVRGQGDVPIYATPEGKAVIDEVAEPKRAQWSPTYGAQWPKETAYPTAVIENGETVELGGLRVRAHELGPCESASEAVFVVGGGDDEPVAFTGDLFYNAHHSYNADGFTRAWLDALDRAPALLAGIDTLYPGHGRPAGPEALAAQRRYLLMLRETVRNLADGEPALSDAAKDQLTARMSAFLPDPALAWLVGLSADAVAAELAAEGVGAGR